MPEFMPAFPNLRQGPLPGRRGAVFALAAALAMCAGSLLGQAKVATWTGEAWADMTRAQMMRNADLMIDSTWSPRRTIDNLRSNPDNYITFLEGVTYRGIAYNKVSAADNWHGFLGKVNTTDGGETSYGNDCSGFVSIVWQLPRRMSTRSFTNEVNGVALLAYSLGEVGTGIAVDLIQGDALNRYDNHIILFDRYSADGVVSAEQTPGPRAIEVPHREMRRNWRWSSLINYQPIRRNLITEVETLPDFLEGDWAATTTGAMNFREGHGTSAAVIAVLPLGTHVRILDHPENGVRATTHPWWHVEVPSLGLTGWLSGRYLEPMLAPAGSAWADIVVDTRCHGFAASASWTAVAATPSCYSAESLRRQATPANDPATWTADLPYAGRYRLYAWWGSNSDPASTVQYLIRHTGGVVQATADQSQHSGRWINLGLFEFARGPVQVALSCWSADGGEIVADAVRFVAINRRPQVVHSYAGWAEETFGSSPGAPDQDPAARPFGHGVRNLEAFAFGLNAQAPDAATLPHIDSQSGQLVLEYRRLREEAEVRYSIETSTDLSSWSPWQPSPTQVQVTSAPGAPTETIRVTLPPSTAPTGTFYRLRLVQDGGL